MAKLHKVSMFVLDVNGEYDSIQELINDAFDRTESSPHFVEAQTVEFPWYDDIILNMGSSTKQDYEDFMDEPTRQQEEAAISILRAELLKRSDLYNGFLASINSAIKECGGTALPFAPDDKDMAEHIMKRIIGEE